MLNNTLTVTTEDTRVAPSANHQAFAVDTDRGEKFVWVDMTKPLQPQFDAAVKQFAR